MPRHILIKLHIKTKSWKHPKRKHRWSIKKLIDWITSQHQQGKETAEYSQDAKRKQLANYTRIPRKTVFPEKQNAYFQYKPKLKEFINNRPTLTGLLQDGVIPEENVYNAQRNGESKWNSKNVGKSNKGNI